MTQVSGSISLELGKVVRETTRAILDALLIRQVPDGGVTPLEEISSAVAARVAEGIMPVLADLGTELNRLNGFLEDLAKSEAIVQHATGTQPVASVLKWDDLVATLSHHLPAGTSHPSVGDESKVAEFQATHLAKAGYAIVPVSREASARADARLAEARRNGTDDSWYEEDLA